MKRQVVSTGTRWEALVGNCRAIRTGNHVHVSGTTATDAQGELVGKDDPYAQAVQIFENIESALTRVGAKVDHVVRTRMYVINIDHWQEIGRAHGEVFKGILPATTLVEVSKLILPDMLVEIEAEAIVPE